MSLVLDPGADPWLTQYESCEKLYRAIVKELNQRNVFPKSSVKFTELSAAIRMKLKQFNTELIQMESTLASCHFLTHEEKERRSRLLEDLQSKNIQLENSHKSGGIVSNETASGGNWFDQDDSDVPLLSGDQDLSPSALREKQKIILSEQDRGLENLSGIISRQKNIAIAINSEVDLHNDIIDDIGTRVESTNVNLNAETTQVLFVSNRDTTCGYWVVIILLFMCIVGVALG